MRGVSQYLEQIKLVLVRPGKYPAEFFLIIASLCGLLFVILIPPMQGGDEPQHFMRAYQLSEGTVLAPYVEHNVGGILPVGIIQLSRLGFYAESPGDRNSKLTSQKFRQLYAIRSTDDRTTINFGNTAVYSPVTYIPQVPAIWLGRLLGLRPLLLLYLARLSGLCFGVVVIFVALRLLPFGRLPMTVLALVPMTVGQLSIVTADTINFAVSFLAVALTLRYAYRGRDMSAKEVIGLVATFVVSSLSKPSLFPIVLLTTALVSNPQIGRKKATKIMAWCMGASILSAGIWNSIVEKRAVIGYQADSPGAVYSQQLHFILAYPLQFIRVLYETFFTTKFNDLPVSFFGKFGWLDGPMPLIFVIAGFVTIGLAIFIASQHDRVAFTRFTKLGIWLGIGAFILITATSLYLFFSPVRLQWVTGLQGRYFIPVAPLVILAFLPGKKTFAREHYERLAGRILYVAAVLLLVGVLSVLGRFYNVPTPKSFQIPTPTVSRPIPS